jgi:hypothetical protein
LHSRACILSIVFFWSAVSLPAVANEPTSNGQVVPTHADAAFIITKYSGFFDRYGMQDATISDCVSFLNGHGVYFGLLEVVTGKEFTRKDCARVMGQITLLFTGDAEYIAGKVKLPKGIDSWETFCIIEDVKYNDAFEAIVKAVNRANETDK